MLQKRLKLLFQKKTEKVPLYDTSHRPNCNTLFYVRLIKYRSDTIRGPGILGDWRLQAELVARRLLAYTPTPSNPSFMGALVQ